MTINLPRRNDKFNEFLLSVIVFNHRVPTVNVALSRGVDSRGNVGSGTWEQCGSKGRPGSGVLNFITNLLTGVLKLAVSGKFDLFRLLLSENVPFPIPTLRFCCCCCFALFSFGNDSLFVLGLLEYRVRYLRLVISKNWES